MKAAAQGSAAIALLPSKENLSSAYGELGAGIDQLVEQAHNVDTTSPTFRADDRDANGAGGNMKR